MPTNEEQQRAKQQVAAMEAIASICEAWKKGSVSFDAAKRVIDDALAGEASRIVRVGTAHTPEIQG